MNNIKKSINIEINKINCSLNIIDKLLKKIPEETTFKNFTTELGWGYLQDCFCVKVDFKKSDAINIKKKTIIFLLGYEVLKYSIHTMSLKTGVKENTIRKIIQSGRNKVETNKNFYDGFNITKASLKEFLKNNSNQQ
jgi:hypothetical protein